MDWWVIAIPMKLHAISMFSLAVLSGVSHAFQPPVGVTIDYVTVGDPGNLADGTTFGAVSYAYQIAKNETTISQYAVFLNAVAAIDTYGLYNVGMITNTINGITQNGLSGSFTYSVNPGSENKPITYVSWFDAARFTNWLHHGQPTGAQDSSTTEDGAYTLLGAVNNEIVFKNVGAKVWIPSEDEWYKAAYYDPNKNGVGVGGYWAQPTQSDTVAGNTIGVANSANYEDGDYVGSGSSSYPTENALTDVGAYGVNSDSAYETNDQAGNVWEWNDAVDGLSRGLRGGSWINGDNNFDSLNSGSDVPSNGDESFGFRVASVPEPTSLVMTMLAGGVMLIRRKR